MKIWKDEHNKIIKVQLHVHVCRLKSGNILYLAKSEAEANNTSYLYHPSYHTSFKKGFF